MVSARLKLLLLFLSQLLNVVGLSSAMPLDAWTAWFAANVLGNAGEYFLLSQGKETSHSRKTF